MFLFSDDHRWRTIVHHSCMVGTDELAFQTLASGTVDDVPEYLTITIHDSVFTREVFVFGMNMESVRLLLCATQFTTQVFAIHTEPQLIGVRGVVSEPIVYVVVRNAGTCTKRYLTAKVRKEV